MKRGAALVALALVLGVGACSSEQDPGLVPEGNDGPSTTSRLLADCSDDPGATIPTGGCLDADGNVVRPGDAP